MVIINRKTMPISKMVEIENAIAKAEKNQADLDYVAMMTDVEIPEEEENESLTEI